MKSVLGLFLLAAVAATVHCSQRFHETEEEFEEEFNVDFLDPQERQKEAKLLKEAEDEINRNNKAYDEGKVTYTQRLYRTSNLPLKEFEREKLGLNSEDVILGRATGAVIDDHQEDPENAARIKEVYRQMDMDRTREPKAYNSVRKGLVTAAKTQGNCNSCVAFATQGLHETCMMKAGVPKKGLDLSEQYVIDCAFNGKSGFGNGCSGAGVSYYSNWIKNNGGMSPHEATYPYLNDAPVLDCSKAKGLNWNSGAKVVESIKDYNCDEKKMMKLVAKYGAVLVAMQAKEGSFNNYKGGVFNGCKSKKVNHAVLIVGYGKQKKGGKYWLVKNSWGPTWGEKGYFRIQRGNNMCGIEQRAVIAICKRSGKREPVPPMPPTEALPPTDLNCDMTSYFGKDFNVKERELRVTLPGDIIKRPKVDCTNGICTPSRPGRSNACVYICGKPKCEKK